MPDPSENPTRRLSLRKRKTKSYNEDDSDEEYEVEEIIGSKYIQGKLCYHIHWKGYDLKDSTWEPAENLKNSNQLLSKFKLGQTKRSSLQIKLRKRKSKRN